jgi:hypothetical protein
MSDRTSTSLNRSTTSAALGRSPCHTAIEPTAATSKVEGIVAHRANPELRSLSPAVCAVVKVAQNKYDQGLPMPPPVCR